MLITGPRACGKSALAEETILPRCERPLYVGTLPMEDCFRSRIRTHQARRGSNWRLVDLVERTGAETDCAITLQSALCGSDGVLLDGLSSLLWHKVRSQGLDRSGLRNCARSIIANIIERPDTSVVIVDCEVPFPNLAADFWFNSLVASLHQEIGDNLNRIYMRKTASASMP
jgi:adenosyl cobinamide kinase/adenosyl cobinamide phosphate guanylyltransferase